jgi:paraquat-inducible protein A
VSPASPPEVDRHVRECPGCGLVQRLPPRLDHLVVSCKRCPTELQDTAARPLDHGIALTLAALVLLVVTCTTTLMSVQTAGITHSAGLFSGPEELWRRRMPELAIVVVAVTVAAPLGKLLGTVYVLARLREHRPPRHLRSIFIMTEMLRPWSMVEVFVFGVFVAYVKLGDVVHIELQIGVFALLALTVVYVWADGALDRPTVWGALDRRISDGGAMQQTWAVVPDRAVGCEICGLVSVADAGNPRCPRCASRLHPRKRNSVARTWALVIAAAVLYIPANYYPVLTVVQLGAGTPSTILGGVEELLASGLYPLAALVFFASIAVPVLKLIGLSAMLIATQTKSSGRLHDRTRLYYIVRWIGRWSMVDIFMEALLGALVRFGNAITIEPGIGAVAFCAVVILTIFAAETFDPRLMWDAAKPSNHDR